MTQLVTSIVADRLDEMIAQAIGALNRGSDLVELRLDGLKNGEFVATRLAEAIPAGRWIATCRPVHEGGAFQGSLEHRLEILLESVAAGAAYVDFERVDWKRSERARSDLVRALTDPAAAEHAPGLILSHHDFERRPPDLDALVDEMDAVEHAAAVKLAWRGDSITSNFDAIDLLDHAHGDAVAICMGEAGLLSRVLAAKFGAFASYASLSVDEAAAPGQITLDEMRNRFRWAAINEATEVYGVIGCPVGHSLSPDLFNRAFGESRVNGVYLPLLVEPTYEAFAAFIDGCLARDWLDVRGFSVTLPHKVHALEYLGDRVDPPADMIGAVNTLRVENGEIWGCNTDCDAALDALLAGMGISEDDLDDLPVDVLGAGGVARAIVAGLTDCGARVTIYNRDPRRAAALAERMECEARSWDERINADGKLLVHCTSVGMWPDVDASPMPADALRPSCAVFDTVYRPRETHLLTDAQAAGCTTIDGLGMFIRQAMMQFEYWTQQAADESTFVNAVALALNPAGVDES